LPDVSIINVRHGENLTNGPFYRNKDRRNVVTFRNKNAVVDDVTVDDVTVDDVTVDDVTEGEFGRHRANVFRQQRGSGNCGLNKNSN
jgi:hypothetical protein